MKNFGQNVRVKGRRKGIHPLINPSFEGLHPASKAASITKRANRKKASSHEVLLRRELWKLGFRYRKYVSDLFGNPDIVFRQARVVVFCDGDFWHGRDWLRLKRNLLHRHNAAYWIAKIAKNRRLDRVVSRQVEKARRQVCHLWQTHILHNPPPSPPARPPL